jgi:hypothetical protein
MARKRDGTLRGALTGLRRAERELTGQLESLRKVIRSIESGESGRAASGKARNLSAKGRAAIARAARKRWAAYRAAKAGKRK